MHHLAQPRLAAPQVGRRDALVLRPKDLYLEMREAVADRWRADAPAGGPHVQIFDEPPLEQPYGGLFFDRFQRLRTEGALVFFSAHPFEPWHLNCIRDTCDRFFFVAGGGVQVMNGFDEFMANPEVADYLAALEFLRAAGGVPQAVAA